MKLRHAASDEITTHHYQCKIYVRAYVRMYVCMYICMYVRMYLNICVYVYFFFRFGYTKLYLPLSKRLVTLTDLTGEGMSSFTPQIAGSRPASV